MNHSHVQNTRLIQVLFLLLAHHVSLCTSFSFTTTIKQEGVSSLLLLKTTHFGPVPLRNFRRTRELYYYSDPSKHDENASKILSSQDPTTSKTGNNAINIINDFIQEGKILKDEIHVGCIRILSQTESEDVVRNVIEEYIKQKKKKAIGNPGSYILAILRSKVGSSQPDKEKLSSRTQERRRPRETRSPNTDPPQRNNVDNRSNKINSHQNSQNTRGDMLEEEKIEHFLSKTSKHLAESPNTQIIDIKKVKRCIKLLHELEKPISSLSGIGPKTEAKFHALGLYTVRSLLWHFPTSFIDRSQLMENISSVSDGDYITTVVRVDSFQRGGRIFKAICQDQAGTTITLNYFQRSNRVALIAQQTLGKPGSIRVISGKVTRSRDNNSNKAKIEMTHPDLVKPMSDLDSILTIEPIYRLTSGLTNKKMTSAVKEALKIAYDLLDEVPSILSKKISSELSLPSLKDALVLSHFPPSKSKPRAHATNLPRMCLALHELVTIQAHLSLLKWRFKHPYGTKFGANYMLQPNKYASWQDSPLVTRAISSLPFQLTRSQMECLSEAWTDIFSTSSAGGVMSKMTRLLQGDVGSGKTIVAFLLGLGCIEQRMYGNIVSILAPTTILANQHYKTFQNLLSNFQVGTLRIEVEILTGSVKGKRRDSLLERIENCGENEACFLIGTHALLSTDVAGVLSTLHQQNFERSSQSSQKGSKGIALAVIDEEQRFGVEQRNILSRCSSHALYMSATPIPRTLALVGSKSESDTSSFPNNNFSMLDLSILSQKPESAKNVRTSIVSVEKIEEVKQGIMRQISKKAKVFWILPLIGDEDCDDGEEDEVINESNNNENNNPSEILNVIDRHKSLSKLFGSDRVGIVHGKMSWDEREKQLQRFADPMSHVDVLVGTSVLEVGIDIPNVSILIVEGAHRFGLSQLHQLRGRIGRASSKTLGDDREELQCHCLLLTDAYDSKSKKEQAMKRLDVLRQTQDGNEVAEADLLIRGPGEMLGLRQSGMSNGYTIHLPSHYGLLPTASNLGHSLLHIPKMPSSAEGFALRVLLCLFGKWTNEGGTGNSLSSLKDSAFGTLTQTDSTIEKQFINFAEKLGGSIHDTHVHFPQSFPDKSDQLEMKLSTEQSSTMPPRKKHPELERKTNVKRVLSSTEKYSLHNNDDVVLMLIDVETTGLSKKSSHIIQIAAKVLGHDEKTFSQYIKPPTFLSSQIESITGITNDFLHKGGVDESTGQYHQAADNFATVYQQFCLFCRECSDGKPVVLMAHNAAFDLGMLNAEIKRLVAYRSPSQQSNNNNNVPFLRDIGIVASIDTLRLLKQKKLWVSSGSIPDSFSLSAIYHHLFNDSVNNAHNALFDVAALERILLSPELSEWRKVAEQIQKPLVLPEGIHVLKRED